EQPRPSPRPHAEVNQVGARVGDRENAVATRSSILVPRPPDLVVPTPAALLRGTPLGDANVVGAAGIATPAGTPGTSPPRIVRTPMAPISSGDTDRLTTPVVR